MDTIAKPLVVIGIALAITIAVLTWAGVDGMTVVDWVTSLVVTALISVVDIIVGLFESLITTVLNAITNVTWDWEWLQPVVDWITGWFD